jgi:N6-adenosine-specific RNA methylase IME4
VPNPSNPYSEMLPQLPPDEYQRLRDDIADNGVQVPIIVDDAGNILDGRHRWLIAQELGVDCPVGKPVVGLADHDKRLLAVAVNVKRRHLTSMQQTMLGRIIEPDIAERARRRQIELAGTRKSDLVDICPQGAGDKTRDEVAAEVGLGSGRTYERNKALLDKVETSHPDLLPDIVAGASDVREIRSQVAKRENEAKLAAVVEREVEAPTGLYDVIVIDPPWDMKKIERDVAPDQVNFDYPTMSEADLAQLTIPADDDCHVWLWTTQKYLPMALRLLEAWGLKYVCTFVWHKPGGFQPMGLPQYNCEFALYARKGSPKFVSTKALPTCFTAPRGAHSEKPEDFYQMLRRCTGGRRLDMFNRRAIDGFEGWGNEAAG